MESVTQSMHKIKNRILELHPISMFTAVVLVASMLEIMSVYRLISTENALLGISKHIFDFPRQGITISFGILFVASFWFITKYHELEIIHHAETGIEAIYEEYSPSVNVLGDVQGEFGDALTQNMNCQHQMAVIASLIAEGDLTCSISPESENDHLSAALSKLVNTLRVVVGAVSTSADTVSRISGLIAKTNTTPQLTLVNTADLSKALSTTADDLHGAVSSFHIPPNVETISLFNREKSAAEYHRAA